MAFRNLFNLSLLALIFSVHIQFLLASPTQVMRRPENFKNEIHHGPSKPKSSPVEKPIEERAVAATGKVQIGYFTNWGIYGRNFQPTDIIPNLLTHVLYSFADVDSSGNIILTDLYADEQKHFPTDSWNDVGNNLYGCLKQLYLLKMANRNLKVLLSIGGWTYSQSGHFGFVTDATARANFVNSAVSMVENLGLDGIDLDFEYPASTAQGQGFSALITSLRTAFDQLAAKKGDTVPYQITAAVSAGAANSAFLDVPTMDKALTYWNLMAYDYAGSWSFVSDDQSNLFGGFGPSLSNTSTDSAFTSYVSRGATASKITMGIPIYGRGFESTVGIYQPFNGIGTGTWEAGVWDYKDLPLAGAAVVENTQLVASYSFDASKGELISYDTPNIAKLKAQYVMSKGMAGSMFWELSADKIGAASLVGTTKGVYGGLDTTQNHLSYPDSVFANIANNMAGGSPTTSGTSTPTSTGTPSGGCGGVAAWSSTAVYTGGMQATFNGHIWTAQWWTQGDTPGGPAGVWVDKGAC